ncbi:MAG: hypothetical protein WD355_11380 [Balneolaceae bacterium]
MTEKHCILLSFLLFGLLLASCGNVSTLTPHHAESPETTVDGNLNDWPTADTQIFSSEAFRFYAKRDSENLYIFVDFLSPYYNEVVNKSGFILYMSQEDQNRKRKGLGFPSGSFHQLREQPGRYEELTTNLEWLNNPQNHDVLDGLETENFERIMIIERYESGSPQYGFVSRSQVEAIGVELEASTDRRYYGMEYKIPLNNAAPFELLPGETYWLGFAIEPPEFRFRDDTNTTTSPDRYGGGMYGRQRSRSSDQTEMNQAMRRQFGQYEEWFKVRIPEE